MSRYKPGAKKTGLLIMLISFLVLIFAAVFGITSEKPWMIVAGFVLFLILLIWGAVRWSKDLRAWRWAHSAQNASTSDDIRAGMARARAYQARQSQPSPQSSAAPQTPGRIYSFRVAGIHYRESALHAVAVPNPDFYNDAAPDGWRVYKYKKELPPVYLMPEPENKYDPNAIGVYIRKRIIGYVPKDETAAVRRILDAGSYSAQAQLTGGPWVSWNDGEMESGEHGFVVQVTIRY